MAREWRAAVARNLEEPQGESALRASAVDWSWENGVVYVYAASEKALRREVKAARRAFKRDGWSDFIDDLPTITRYSEDRGVVIADSRSWCIHLDSTSTTAARNMRSALERIGGFDVECDSENVMCFADHEGAARRILAELTQIVRREYLEDALARPPYLRRWNESRKRYVDPDDPEGPLEDEDEWLEADVSPEQIGIIVELRLASVWDHRPARRVLRALRRPVIREGNRSLDVGALDEDDAAQLIEAAQRMGPVVDGRIRRLGWIQRWRLRQRLSGNYSTSEGGDGFYFQRGDAGGGDGGGDDGGGHGGH